MLRLTHLVLVALVLAVLPTAPAAAAPAAAASCFPAGGASIPAATARGEFVVSGRGWGHGVGMSQYGAQGAAALGCSAEQILTTYFPGTRVTSAPLPTTIRVSLSTGARSVPVEAHSGPIPWDLCSSSCTRVANQPAGTTWTVVVGGNGSYRLLNGSSTVWSGGSTANRLHAVLNGKIARVRVATAYRYNHGTIEFDSRSDALGTAFVTNELPFEQYLYGLSEMPSSWQSAALQAQAIAGRSYALKRVQRYGGNRDGCRCDVYATVVDQHFTAYEKEGAPTYGARWVAAVNATAGRVLDYQGNIADTFYSSSHGGYSEASAFVWGGSVAYLRPVDDTRWEQASVNPAGNLTWAKGFSADELGARLGVGRATSVDLPAPRGHAGRVGDPARGHGGVVVRGTSGTKHVSGDTFMRALGLKSTLFTVEGGVPELTWGEWVAQPAGEPVSAPGVVSWGSGRSDVFVTDGAGRLLHRWELASGWGPGGGWEVHVPPAGVSVVGQPAVVSRRAGSIDVFVRGSDDAVWQRSYVAGRGWIPWQRRGGVVSSSPGAVSWGPDHVAVVVAAPDGAVWQLGWDGRRWSGWSSLGGRVSSAPSVVSWGPGRLDVFVRAGDDALYHRWFVGGRWAGSWVREGGVLHGDGAPGAVSWGAGRLDAFVVGRGGGGVWRRGYQTGFGWLPTSGFEGLGSPGGVLASGTAAVSWGGGHLEVFVTDSSGRLWSRSTT